jgi:hypothetical protein
MNMKFGSLGLCLLLVASLPIAALGATPTSVPEVSSRPILFLHGFNPFGIGENCKKDWSKMEQTLSQQGFTGPMLTLGYYHDDQHCDVKITPHGTILTHISEISKDLAWYVYNNYSSKNIDVDIVAHSMGGLVLRYALYRVAVSDSSFPPYLLVNHAATLASPYTGYSLLAESCHINVVNLQCDDMFPLSGFIEGLKKPEALVPQGRGGTIWSDMGSNAVFIENSDGFVTSASATSMQIPASAKIVLPWHMFVLHTLYTRNKKVMADMVHILSRTSQNQPEDVAQSVTYPPVSRDVLEASDAVISREELTQDFSALPQDKQPASLDANVINGETVGISFTKVLPSGVFAQMGIQDDDVVRGCSNTNINTPFEALDELENSTGPIVMNFCLVRDGKMISKQVVVQ